MNEFDHLRGIFIAEAEEQLSRIEQALIKLEKTPDDAKLLHEVFRVVHSVKGNAATMELRKMTELSHEIENFLEPMHKGKKPFLSSAIELMLSCLDALRGLLREVREGRDLAVSIDPLVERLKDPRTASASAPVDGKRGERSAGAENPAPQATVRVGLSRLDNVLNLIEELSISKARLETRAQGLQEAGLKEEVKTLSRLINELQQEALQTRMVPVAEIFDRFRRVVRDTAHSLNKEVTLKIEDNAISVDRVLLEKISEPLVHLLRNAVDHGLEDPAQRRQEGKPVAGEITLRATGEHGFAVIEVIDDGRGMDPVHIRQRAVQLTILNHEEAAQLSDAQALYLICDPRFTTAERVTEISGRGVGMHTVFSVIHAVNGRLEISSKPGRGTRFSLRLPLSLAIAQSLLVRTAGQTYAIPLTDVAEILSLESVKPLYVDNQSVIALRGEVIPLLSLSKIFDLGSGGFQASGGGYGVIVRGEKGRAALYVDEVVGRQEIVIKNLSGLLRNVKGFNSATILGDGRAVLVVDVGGLL